MSVQRMAMIIGIRPEKIAHYRELHAHPWSEMDAALSAANIRNYSIYLREPENLLFGYWEYTGSDFVADMQALNQLAISRKWLALTDPCQKRLESASQDEWWSMIPEVYHLD